MEYLKQTNTQKQKADWQSPEYGQDGVKCTSQRVFFWHEKTLSNQTEVTVAQYYECTKCHFKQGQFYVT